jgi:hypothetical protein
MNNKPEKTIFAHISALVIIVTERLGKEATARQGIEFAGIPISSLERSQIWR